MVRRKNPNVVVRLPSIQTRSLSGPKFTKRLQWEIRCKKDLTIIVTDDTFLSYIFFTLRQHLGVLTVGYLTWKVYIIIVKGERRCRRKERDKDYVKNEYVNYLNLTSVPREGKVSPQKPDTLNFISTNDGIGVRGCVGDPFQESTRTLVRRRIREELRTDCNLRSSEESR